MLLLVLALADTVSGAAQPTIQAPPAAVTALAQPSPNPATPPAADAQPAAAAPAAPAAPASPPAKPMPDTAALQSVNVVSDVVQPRDPWVKANRGVFAFNIALEKNLLAPVAHGYNHVIPHVVRYHVTSALFNLGEPLTAVNDLLQLRFHSLGNTIYRFVINSTLGVAGLFDFAKTKGGIPIHISDFGQTLGRYGAKPGPYVMIPLLGPSDFRDGIGRIVDNFADPVEFFIGGITSPEGISLFALEGIDWRSRSDDTMKAIYGATDPYAFTRSAYTQSRVAIVAEATGKQVALPDFDAPEPVPKKSGTP